MHPFLIVLIAFIGLRLIFWLTCFPNPDEAYYWLWGQHLDWSYYDHPPLQAWVQGIFTGIFGRSNLVLRLPNLLSNLAFFYIYYQIMIYLYGKESNQQFWLVVLLILASPLYFLFLALAWHDHLLITFSLLAMYWLITFLDGYIADGKGKSWRLYATAGAIALASLCKYNAFFVPIGFLAALIADSRLRPLLRDRRLYIASAIALTAFIPILIWNISNDWQSFRYYLNRSVNSGGLSLKFSPFLNFVLFSILMVSPLQVWGFYRSLKQPVLPIRNETTYRAIALWIFLVSTVALIIISLLSAALYYWNITAYLLLFPLLPAVWNQKLLDQNARQKFVLGDRTFLATQFYGFLFASLLIVHYCIIPISAFASQTEDPDSRMLFGWDRVATVVKQQAIDLDQPLFITTDYRSASALAYQLNARTVIAISDRVDQFDFWDFTQQLQGKQAVILSDDWHPLLPELRTQLTNISAPIVVPVDRFGVWIKNYYVMTGVIKGDPL